MKSADIVLLARLHSYVDTPQMRKCPPIYKVPAFKKIPVGELGPTKSLLILEQAKKDVAAVK